MKVIFVSHVSGKYGGGRSLLDLIDGLLGKGVKCYVFIPCAGALIDEFEKRKVEYQIVPIKSWCFPGKIPGRLILKHALCSVLNIFSSLIIAIKALSWRADIICSNSSIMPVGALAAFVSRKPHVWHIREFGKEDYGQNFDFGESLTYKMIDKFSSYVIVISEALRRKFAQYVSDKKLIMIHDAISIPNQQKKPVKSDIPVLAIVGLLHPTKGQAEALLAIAQLFSEGIMVKLVLAGGGEEDYITHLKKIVHDNKVDEQVEFTGYLDDPSVVYNTADIILICSQFEALGRVTIEGMLHGKPVIGARSGATPELIQEGFNGLLYESGNHLDLAAKIKYLLAKPSLARQMGQNGQKEATGKFSIENYADKIFTLFQSAIKK